MSQDPGGVRCGPQGAPDSTDVMGPDRNFSEGWGVLSPPLQGISRCNPRRTPVPYNVQCVNGLCNPIMGGSGGGDVGVHGGTRSVGAGPCGLFLRG